MNYVFVHIYANWMKVGWYFGPSLGYNTNPIIRILSPPPLHSLNVRCSPVWLVAEMVPDGERDECESGLNEIRKWPNFAREWATAWCDPTTTERLWFICLSALCSPRPQTCNGHGTPRGYLWAFLHPSFSLQQHFSIANGQNNSRYICVLFPGTGKCSRVSALNAKI